MSTNFNQSKTKENLMRAFAGESQARNRYTFAADIAKNQNQYVIEAVFKFTADQEKEHAEIFYGYLSQFAGEHVSVDGNYPVNLSNSLIDLLRWAKENELAEYSPIYKEFGDIAKEEGFHEIAAKFHSIAEIEKSHGERFDKILELLEQNKLYVSSSSQKWMCLNCGHTFEGGNVPEVCPVCHHEKGYFIRLELAPYTQN